MKDVVLVTGSGGLIGSEAVRFFADSGYIIVGIDNDLRSYMFGAEASTKWNVEKLKNVYKSAYIHINHDIREIAGLRMLFDWFGPRIRAIIHTAACPSHDWAAKEPLTDFGVNAMGTLNLLECTRQYCNDAVFVFTSTNKVYGDTPNRLPLVEQDDRYELDQKHPWFWHGIPEEMSIDNSKHSVFGASKVAADVMVQEYGKYFGMPTGVFRGGCLTGPSHSGAEAHGFLSYLVKCIVKEKQYTVYGRKGKTVRDNIHSFDVITAFDEYIHNPKCGEVYNIGGNRFSNCSMLEAIRAIEALTSKKANVVFSDVERSGDHIWYISSMEKFKKDYPNWKQKYNMDMILREIVNAELTCQKN